MPSNSSLWFGSALFASLGLFATLAAMLPLGLSADAWVMPDLFFCIAFYWVVRRADTAPIALICCVTLFADVMLMRPLGLWSFVMILSMELVRYQRLPIREQMFIVEWILFAFLFAAALLLNALMLTLSFSTSPSFDLTISYFVSTVAAYPLVVGVLYYVFRIRVEKAPTGSNRLGRVQ